MKTVKGKTSFCKQYKMKMKAKRETGKRSVNIQQKTTKMIRGLEQLPYEEIEDFQLGNGVLKGVGMIEAYKIVRGVEKRITKLCQQQSSELLKGDWIN